MKPALGEATNSDASFASLKAVRSPGVVRWVVRLVVITFVLFPIALVFVPWQQTVQGRGQIVAYLPTERKQVVTAMISGQVKKWYVRENSRVKLGDPIVDIEDNDAELSGRLDAQREFLSSQRKAAYEGVSEQRRVVEAQEKAMDAAVAAAEANRDAAEQMIDVARQTQKNNELALKFEQDRFEMFDKLYQNKAFGGLESKLSRDEAKVRADRAATDVRRAEAEVKRATATVQTNESLVKQARANGLSAVATARSALNRGEENLFAIDRQIQELDSRIERFKARFVKAPCDGYVFRVAANTGSGGQFVKEGEDLAVIVPDTDDRVVELFINGVDAPLVAAHMEQLGVGPHVRIQFEGWPSVQFTGWPSVAVGTFGGRVRQIDSTDDGYGRFRILVEPEEMFEGDRWPEPQYLRQGNQAVGWVFLNRVTMGYELWRQLNGFPPVVAPKPPEKKDEKKPPKLKV